MSIINNKLMCVQYLKNRVLIFTNNPMTCIKIKDVLCNGKLFEYLCNSKKEIPISAIKISNIAMF